MGYRLASIVAGGPAPLIAAALLASFGSSVPIPLCVAAMAAVTIVAVAAPRENGGSDLREVAVSERRG